MIRDSDPVPVIFDTDMATDCDDAGALAMLHALEQRGEADILAAVVNNKGDRSTGAVAAINAFYGRSDIPLGAYQGDDVGTEAAPFFADIATDTATYGHDTTTRTDVPNAVTVYRQALAAADSNDAVIVSVGHLNNLHGLLNSGPGPHSPSDGRTLVRRKVDRLVVMGGVFPSGTEHNFSARGSAAYTEPTLEQWPTPVVFSGYELGDAVRTGPALAELDETNPVRRAYAGHPTDPLEDGRQSWDQTAVLAAVRDPEQYWKLSDTGQAVVESDGSNSWESDPEGSHRYLIERDEPNSSTVADLIEDLMVATP